MTLTEFDESWLAQRLGDAAPGGLPPGPAAAVLVPLVRQADGWHLLFIRRTVQAEDPHSGQVAFPGGHLESGDRGVADCALREAREELGLDADRVRILGTLNLQRTHYDYPVHPVVGVSEWPVTLTPDPAEVAHSFTVPMAWLIEPANRQPVRFLVSDGHWVHTAGFRAYRGEVIWGLTARVILELLQRIGVAPA